jgi:RsiW-degrading membrane proteinase PrsW (M82 family)
MDNFFTFLPIIVLLVGAVLPVAIIMLWVYCRDKLREPVSVVLLTMLFGGLATLPIIIVEIPLSLAFGVGLDAQITTLWQAVAISFVVAALVEESFKFGVLRLYSARHSAFDEPFDGIVYGIAASLGFALVENIMYVFGSMYEGGFAGGFVVAIVRSIFAVPMHASCGVIMGACIGLSRFGRGGHWTFIGIIIAIAIHGTYDTFLFSMEVPEVAENDAWIGLLFLGVILTTLLSVGVSALIISRFRRGQIQEVAVRSATYQQVAIATKPSTSKVFQKSTMPRLPIISLILSVIATGLPIVSILVAMFTFDEFQNVPEGIELLIGLGILASLIFCIILLPVSIVSICVEPRWRAASIVSLVVAVALFLLEILIMVIGANY